jgi:hypothetical protein
LSPSFPGDTATSHLLGFRALSGESPEGFPISTTV